MTDAQRKLQRFWRESYALVKPKPKPRAQRQLEEQIYYLKSDIHFILDTIKSHMETTSQPIPQPILEILKYYKDTPQ